MIKEWVVFIYSVLFKSAFVELSLIDAILSLVGETFTKVPIGTKFL